MTDTEQKVYRIYTLADCIMTEPTSSLWPKGVEKDRVTAWADLIKQNAGEVIDDLAHLEPKA